MSEIRESRAARMGWTPDLVVLPLMKLLLHLVTYRGYGIFRDEFYYLACSDRLSWGYVDQPPLSVLLLKLQRTLFGDSLFSIRLLPAVAGALTILLVGLIARRLGGGSFARVTAMTAALVAPIYLSLDHFYSMNAFDILIWGLAAYLCLVIFQEEGDEHGISGSRIPGLWILLGVVLGLGLQNKISVLWLGAGLAVGLLATMQRRWLATRWPWLAGAIAMAIFIPYVLWQAANDWPTLEFIANATSQKMRAVGPLELLASQAEMMNPLTLPIWGLGLFWFARRREMRIFAVIWLVVFAILAFNKASRPSYLSPTYTWLLPAGAVAIEAFFRRRQWDRARWVVPIVVLIAGSALAPQALPILSTGAYIEYARALGEAPSTAERKELAALPQFYADMHGWESFVGTVESVWESLPENERAGAAVFTGNYGEAGAIEALADDNALRAAVMSSHNNYWFWGPRGSSGHPVIFLGASREGLLEMFDEVELAARTDCGFCMPYENDVPVWICRGARVSIEELWPELKHYD